MSTPHPDRQSPSSSTSSAVNPAPDREAESVGHPDGAKERRALAWRASIVGAGTLLSRVFGLGREMVLAAAFSRLQTDAFFLAFTIPNALRQLLAEGAVSSAVVPVLSEVRERQGEKEAQEFFRMVRGLSLAALLVVTVAGVLLAEPIVEVFAAGYHQIPGQFERTVLLTRWVFPYILFMGTAALGMAALNTHRQFAVPAFAPALLNVAIIIAALALPTWLKERGYEPVLALAVGALFGGALQVVAQWPSLRRIGFAALPTWNLKNPAVRDVVRRMTPMMFGLGIYYVDIVVSRRFLSEMGVGAQSYFMWALRLCDFPQGIFVMALSTAALPSLSSLAAVGDRHELRKTYAYSLRLAMFVAIPASVLFSLLAYPIVVAFFQRGHFGHEAAVQTSHALMAQAIGIWAVAGVRQLIPVYYALGDTRTPVVVSLIDFLAFVSAAVLLRGSFGHVGIGLAVSIASFVQFAFLWALLRRKMGSLMLREIFGSMAKTLISSLVAGSLAWWFVASWAQPSQVSWWRRPLPAIAGTVVFLVVFVAIASLVRSTELLSLSNAVHQKLARRLRKS